MMEYGNLVLEVMERQAVEDRTTAILDGMDANAPINEQLTAYCAANGYAAEEARELIDQKVIPLVNDYNKHCAAAMRGDPDEYILSQISERVDGMSVEDEYKYKLNILKALRAADMRILVRAGAMTDEQNEAELEELSKDDGIIPEGAPLDERALESVNLELSNAISNSAVNLQGLDSLQDLIDEGDDESAVKAFTTRLWADERYKYAAALAVCAARKNGEITSMGDDVPDEALIIGMCRGVDVANVAIKVSRGEMAADMAVKVLKVIGAVAVMTLAICVMCHALLFLTGLIIVELCSLLGAGIGAFLVCAALSFGAAFAVAKAFGAVVPEVLTGLGTVVDVAYSAIKRGVKTLISYAKEVIFPAVMSGIARIRELHAARRQRVHA